METISLMDPRHSRRQNMTLFVGYALVGCAVTLLSVILLLMAIGYGYKNGQVIQSGLVFVSSVPRPAQIYINGKRYKNDTNTRLLLPAGTYNFSLHRAGYRDWQRSIDVVGLQVQSFTYPFLFPTSLTSSTFHDYAGQPAFVSQSSDHRWLLVSSIADPSSIDVYDLSAPKKPPIVIAIPAGILTAGKVQTFQQVAWADDSTHLLLKHEFDNKVEYVLINRANPAATINLTKTLNLSDTDNDVRLDDNRYDHYLVLDNTSHVLFKASLTVPALTPYITGVLTYDAYGGTDVLYVSPNEADKAKVNIDLFDGTKSYLIRQSAVSTTYLLALSAYQGDLYAAVSDSNEKAGFIYQNPIAQITNPQLGVAIPVRVLSIKSPNYVSFSVSGQYAFFENKTDFASYDVESQQRYLYSSTAPIDQPQVHASWMDGARLQYVSQGQLVVFDFDGMNRQTLVSSDAHYLPIYDANYKTLYTFVPAVANKSHALLTATSLRAPADQ